MGYKRTITVDDKAITEGAGLTLKQSLIPCGLVTILFFLWGFAYGLLDVLNSHFRTLLHLSNAEATGITAAYFGAYFICPLTISGWILRRFGFRVTFMTGLAILAVGSLLFWPSGVKASFGGFCGSMFVVGAGLSTLEVGADNFLAICGPPRYSEIRLNLAQGIQGVGSFVAPLLASRVFFAKTIDDAAGLKNVQWVYLGVACFVALLIVLFYFAPMPEVTDADMNLQEVDIGGEDVGPLRQQYGLFLGVWSQFCYVGAQVAVANFFIDFCVEAGNDKAWSSDLFAIGQGLYALNRFIAAYLMTFKIIKPRYILAVYLGLCFVFSLAATLTHGMTSVALLILLLCFESACFATIFTLALRGLGRHTKIGGSFLVAAISGGAAIPPMTGAVATRTNYHHAMAIPTVFYVLAYVFPVYANFWKARELDEHRGTDLNISAQHQVGVRDAEKGGANERVEFVEGK
ncbi:glucose/galactose transporter [Dendryphion nanum]|uniref:Glucose/galactose transporter n=1 Tax=Dendryphion nanum TaxID=256645 RepID=A0A9P9ID33_9PLEO|nr:glucose/galactose transporter [Dendryphion nanum]